MKPSYGTIDAGCQHSAAERLPLPEVKKVCARIHRCANLCLYFATAPFGAVLPAATLRKPISIRVIRSGADSSNAGWKAVKTSHISHLIKENKTLFIIIIVGLFLLELEIFALAAMKSGRQSWLQVIDGNGTVIYETSGKNLSEFNKYYFEKTFGPFENYDVRLVTRDRPFPFRAWFVAAIGIPVGAMLLFGFVVKAYVAIFHGSELQKDERRSGREPGSESRLESILYRISRMNIFIIGFLIFVGVISYWIIPNMITYIGRTGIETVIRFKWVFITLGAVVVGIGLWIIYLRYLLAKKSIESRTEIEKHRLALEYQAHGQKPLRLDAPPADDPPRQSLDWDPADRRQSPTTDPS